MKLTWPFRRRARHRPSREAVALEWAEPRLLFSADLAAGLGLQPGVSDGDAAAAAASATPTASQVASALAAAPLVFEENRGQLGSGTDYAAFGSGYAIVLDNGNARISDGAGGPTVELRLVGADPNAVGQGEGPLAARSNYLLGDDPQDWHTDIPNHEAVRYRNVWQGIDIRYYGNQRELEYDFIVAAGADASQVRLSFTGAQSVSIADNGDLVVRIAGSDRELRFAAPVSYQFGANGKEAVASAYRIFDDGTVGFELGEYDHSRALVIDPVLKYGSYLGGTANDVALDVAVGADGSVYVTGRTASTNGDVGSPIAGAGGAGDIFVAKFSADLSTLVYLTRIGGTGLDQGNAIAVDASGNAVVTGLSQSSNFPMLNAATGSKPGGQDAVVFKLNAAGNGLVFSTWFGSNGSDDSGNDVAVDGAGNIYVAGQVDANTLLGLGDLLLLGSSNAFLNKYSASGAALMQIQYGGGSNDAANGLALDGAGNIYIVGDTSSSNLPMTGGPQTSRGSAQDGFLAKFNASGTRVWSTYIGGNEDDYANAVAVDSAGRAYVVGQTDNASGSNFQLTGGALMTTRTPHLAGYLRIYDTTVTGAGALKYSTLIGGTKDQAGNVSGTPIDNPTGITLVGSRVAVVGTTSSSDLLTTAGALDTATAGTSGFLWVIDPKSMGAADLVYGTYYGEALATGGIASRGNTIYLSGGTATAGLAVPGGHNTGIRGGDDALVAAIELDNNAPVLAGINGLAGLLEDPAANAGTLVSTLLAGQLSDIDGMPLAGLAVIGADSSNGIWQYTLDGSTWITLPAVSASGALLLASDATTRLRFVPNANFNGTASLTVRGWDRTSGTAGTLADASVVGGTSAFSVGSAVANITVTARNDAPVASDPTVPLTVLQNAAATSLGLGGLTWTVGGGADEAAQTLSVYIAGVPNAAFGDIVLADGTTVVMAGTTWSIAQLQGMQFRAAPGASGGPAMFTFEVRDNGGTANGGTDKLTQSVQIVIDGSNQAPILTGANNLAGTTEDSATGSSISVAALLAGYASDGNLDPVGIAVIGADSARGTWQYSVDGGTNWADLTGASASSARLLGATSLVRFIPAADWNGTLAGGLSFRAWDQTSGGVAGDQVDIVVSGGYSSFSAATASASVTVTPVNDAPTTAPVSLGSVAEDSGSVTITAAQLLANAGDIEADGLAVSAVSASTGSLVDNGNGTWTWTPPAADFNGPVSFSYTITDNGTTNGVADAKSVAGTATLTVTTVNDAPATAPVSLGSVAEDSGPQTFTTAQLLANAADIEGNGFIVNGLTASVGTMVDNGDGTWTWTPPADFNGLVSFSYTITDNGTSDGVIDPKSVAGTASLTVTTVNDAPTTAPVSLGSVAEDSGSLTITAAQLLANAGDPEGDGLAVSGLTASTGTLVDNGGGTWTWTAPADFNGAVSFSYTITDNGTTDGVADPKTVAGTASLTVTTVNDAPTTTPVSLGSVAEDSGSVTITAAQLLANAGDIENDGLAVSGVTASVGALVDNGGGTWTWTPPADFNGAVTFSYTITDNGTTDGVADPKMVAGTASLTVTTVNDAPTTAPVSLGNVAEDSGSLTITAAQLLANAADIESDGLAVSGVTASTGTLVDNGDGTWTWTPPADFNGPVSFSYTITDSGTTDGVADPKAVAGTASLTVTTVNDAPTTAPVSLGSVAEDSASVTITAAQLLANAGDIENDGLTVTGVTASAGTLVDNGNGTWTWTPAADFNGPVSISYTITDNGTTDGVADPKSVTGAANLTVTTVNDAPTTTPVSLGNVAEDSGSVTITAAQLLANAGDIEGDGLAVSGVTASAGMLVDSGGGTWTWTPPADFNGAVTFSYTITDNGTTDGVADPRTVAGTASLTVTTVNDAPTTAPVSLGNVAEDSGSVTITAAQLLVNAGDIENDGLTVSGVMASTGTLVDNGNGTWTWTPAANFNGPVSFSYTITDNGTTDGVADPKTVAGTASLTVTTVNDAPTTTPVSLGSVAEDSGSVTITAAQLLVNAGDVEGNGLTVSGVTASAGTLVDNGNGTWTWTPAANFNGPVSFSYTIADNGTTNGAADPRSVAGTAALTVTAVNDAPTITLSAASFTEDTAATADGAVAASFTTADVDSASVTVGFTAGTNLAGHYRLGTGADAGKVLLTAAGAAWANAGHALEAIQLTASDGLGSATAQATPGLTLVDDAPALSLQAAVVATAGSPAVPGGLAATYALSDEDTPAPGLAIAFAPGSNALGHYELGTGAQQGQVLLTRAGADWINAGGQPEAIQLVARDASNVTQAQATPGTVAVFPSVPGPAPGPTDPGAPAPPAATGPAAPVGGGDAAGEEGASEEPADQAMAVGSRDGDAFLQPTDVAGFTLLERPASGLALGTQATAGGAREAEGMTAARRAGGSAITLDRLADLQVVGLRGLGEGLGNASQDELQGRLREPAFLEELDRLRDRLREEFQLESGVTVSVASVSLGVSVVYVLWLIRGGVLVSSYLSALPAWKVLDPLPVLSRLGADEPEEEGELDADTARADPLRGFQ
jgi:hypothetical protein